MQHHLSDQIEDYLLDRLNAQERTIFEQNMQSDINLRQETSAQNEIIEALKTQRRLELKQNLSSVQVGLYYGAGRIVGLWTAGVAASLIIGGLIWWQFQSVSNKQIIVSQNNNIVDSANILASGSLKPNFESSSSTTNASTSIASMNLGTNTVGVIKKVETVQQPNTLNINKTVAGPTRKQYKSKTKFTDNNAISGFDKPEIGNSDEQTLYIGSSQDPSVALSIQGKKSSSKKPDVILFKQQNQAYEYYEGKLYLYGDFDQNLYELIELNELEQHYLYLYLKNNYYQLSPTRQKQELLKITDDLIINKLNILRKQKVD